MPPNSGRVSPVKARPLFRIPLTRPYITPEIKARVAEVLDSGYLTEGPVTREF
jgi:perosamine synthetase